jgi:hypothetical protein
LSIHPLSVYPSIDPPPIHSSITNLPTHLSIHACLSIQVFFFFLQYCNSGPSP